MHVRTAVALAWRTGLDLNLGACDYGPGAQGQFRAGPPRYYHFLAGLAQVTAARRILEVGTHYGGSARALAEGQRAAGLAPNVLTYDVEDRAGAPILGVDGIERVLADVRDTGQARLSAWAGTEPIDLVYIDALKDAEFVETTVAALADRTIGVIVFDDVFANASIRTAWNRIRYESGDRAVTVDEVVLGIRGGGYGQGVVVLDPAVLAGLSTEPSRPAAHRRWSRVAGRLASRRTAGDTDLVRDAVAGCTGEGEVVMVGANAGTARAMAEALATRADLDHVSVNVIGSFLGARSPSDPHYTPVRRGEPSLVEFRQQLGDAAGRVNLLAGDVPSLRWPGRPIELAMVNWYRDAQQLGFVWREILPWCIPGGSLIVIDGIRGGAPDPPTQLGPLLGHLEILATGRDCLALAPIDAVMGVGGVPPTRLSALGVSVAG